MYVTPAKQAVDRILTKIANKNHVPVEQIKKEIEEAMNSGRNNPDPAVQALWAEFRYAGPEPTVEEFILWVTALAKERQEKLS